MKKSIAGVVIIVFALTVTWVPAHAALVSTAEIINQDQGTCGREDLTMLLERSEVRAALESWGVSGEEAQARVDTLTDQEITQLADHFDKMPAGGSALGTLVGAALFVFLVLLITDILGYTDVFPFADKAD
ncbi:MAG: PA2779 family protein [Thermodesulfobacteriota bacterium]